MSREISTTREPTKDTYHTYQTLIVPTDDTYQTLQGSDPENTAQQGEPTNDSYQNLSVLTDAIYQNIQVTDPGNTAQHGGFKQYFFKAVTVCVGLLLLAGIVGLLLLACIVGLVIRNLDLTKQRDQLETRLNNMTELRRIICESHGFTFGGGGVCYYISTEKKNWNDSRADCTARQSDLVTIKSKDKQDFVNTVVGRDKLVWIGLTDGETEGEWKWIDGTPLTTPYWGSNQPNGDDEDCVVFDKGEWHDYPCGLSQYCYWMCGMRIN